MSSLKKRKRNRQSWVVVASAHGMPEAKIIAGLLETNDIPNHLHYESVGQVWGLSFGTLGQVQVLVPERYEQVAMALLDDPTLDDSSPQLDGPSIEF